MLLPLLLATLGATCPPATGPAVLVDVLGLKDRSGQVRVRVFGDPPSTYFDKRHVLTRIEVPVPAEGRLSFCIPVPHPGPYAVDIRHDTNMNGKTDRSDGGGASGNPKVSLLDLLFSRKPPVRSVQVQVGNGVTSVPITVMYLQGGSVRPWR